MDLTNQLIELRILLEERCDGFWDNGKNTILSNKLKILYMLENVDCSPNEFINTLCMAKSNVATLLKKMIGDNLVDSYKSKDNNKNIYYKITDGGIEELKRYKDKLIKQFLDKCDCDLNELRLRINSVIEILKGTKL